MVCLRLNTGTAIVGMEAVQVGVDGLNGRLGLQRRPPATGFLLTLACLVPPEKTSFRERSKPIEECRRGEGRSIGIAVA